MLEIKETMIEDLKCVQQLWADGDVMKFVGFPDGLHKTDEGMQNWFRWIKSNRPALNHYSIFEDGKYCGESFYEINAEHRSAALDINCLDLHGDVELQRPGSPVQSKKRS